MGVAIENANAMTKAFGENQDSLVKSMKNQTMRISTIEDVNYKISYLMSSSVTGKRLVQHDPSSEDMF